MIGTAFKDYVNSKYGLTAADKERAAKDFDTAASNIYRMMADGDYYIYETDKLIQLYKLNKEIKK